MELKFLLDFLGIRRRHDNIINDNLDIVIDSRKVKKNDIFIGIKGNNVDGNLYAKEAISRGAIFAIVDNKEISNGDSIFYVEDSIKFLGLLASSWRDEVGPIIFGITGSSGKTTVKEMVSSILSNVYGKDRVLTTLGNLNNHIGLPLTLLSLNRFHRYGVIEMGMNHFGEMEYLSKILRPDYALINNIQRAHIGCGFNSIEDIAKAKSEIFIGLSDNGVVILPREDSQYYFLSNLSLRFRQRTFGMNEGDIRAFDIDLRDLYSTFRVNYLNDKIDIFLPIPGICNISNVLASISMVNDLGIDSNIIIDSFKEYKSINGRMNIFRLSNGVTLINDTYNSNPDSMKFAIDVLAKFRGVKILIMGDMGELGDMSLDYHFEVGLYAKGKGIDLGFFVGDLVKFSCDGFGVGGFYFDSKDSLIRYIIDNIKYSCVILVKGSRFMGMEDIFVELKDKINR